MYEHNRDNNIRQLRQSMEGTADRQVLESQMNKSKVLSTKDTTKWDWDLIEHTILQVYHSMYVYICTRVVNIHQTCHTQTFCVRCAVSATCVYKVVEHNSLSS